MSLVIRFSRVGKRGEAKFRVVVSEKRSRRDGRPIDTLGYFEKRLGGVVVSKIDKEKVKSWITKGAQLSESVKKAL